MVANYLLNGMILQIGEVFMMFFVFEKKLVHSGKLT